jgi:hypothetical protein
MIAISFSAVRPAFGRNFGRYPRAKNAALFRSFLPSEGLLGSFAASSALVGALA